MSGISLSLRIGSSINTQTNIQMANNLNQETQTTQTQAQQAAAIRQAKQEVIGFTVEALSTLLMFTGIMVGGLGGTLGTTIGNIMIVGGDMVDNIYDLKKAVKELLTSRQLKNLQTNIESHISDVQLQKVQEYIEQEIIPKTSTLSVEQKQKQVKQKLVESTFDSMMNRPSTFRQFPLIDVDFRKDDNFIGQFVEEPQEVNLRSDLLGNSKENTQTEIVDSKMEVSVTNNIQELKNFLKRHFAVRVKSDSMKDKLRTGDIVAAKKVRRFSRYNIGDIIVFIRDGVKIVHEIVNIKYENYKIKYETKGINNLNPDIKLVTKKNIIGKIVMSTKNLDLLLDLVKQGRMTVYDAFGLPDILNERQLNSVQGRLIKALIDLFPADYFESRGQVSEAFFGDPRMLSHFLAAPKKYVHKLRRGLGNIQAKHLEDDITGKPINKATVKDIKEKAKPLIKEFNIYIDYQRHYFAEEYTRYFAQEIFGEFFLSDHTFSWLLYFDTHVDLYCPALSLVIEYDGSDKHFYDPKQKALDQEKERRCKLRGIDVIRMTKFDDKKQFEQLLSERYEAITGKLPPNAPHLDPAEVARFIRTHVLPNKYREEHGELSF